MTVQELFEENIDYLIKFTKIKNEEMINLESFLKEKGAKNQNDIDELLRKNELSDLEIDRYYKVSQMLVDTRILFQKICDIIYYASILNLDLNTERLDEITNLPLFVREYRSYKTNFTISAENTLEEINKKEYNNSKINFRKIINDNNIMKFIDESRNTNPS